MKSFNKTNPKKKLLILSTIVMAIAISLVCISFAFYQKEDDVGFINGIVRLISAKDVSYENDNYNSFETVDDALSYLLNLRENPRAELVSSTNENHKELTNVKEALDYIFERIEVE